MRVFRPGFLESCGADSALPGLYAQAKPFSHLFVEGVIDDGLLRQAKDELLAGEWYRKRVDLYDFLQTDHLRRAEPASALLKLNQAFYSPPFRRWIESITGVRTLAEPVDTSAAKYGKGGHLLCHDDDLSGRVIAFILYLVPEDWAPEDGGALDLFDSDPKTGFPTAVAKSLAPRWNSLAFFTVTPGSFHQVAEVLSASKGSRLSISGWFHGKAPPRPTPLPLPAPRFSRPRPMTRRGPPKPKPSAKRRAKREEEDEEEEDEFVLDLEALGRWVHPRWLAHAVSGTQMSSHFASNGSIELVPFLREDAYAAALKAMRVQQWVAAGPPHVRQYRVAAACHCEGGGGPGAIPDEAPMAAAAPAAAMVEPLQVTEPETGGAAPGTTTSGYRRHNGTNGGPGDAWRSQSAAVPDAAVQLWQAMRSPAMAFLLHAITGAGTVQEWAVEARALGPGSYTLVSDPELRRHRHKSGGSPDSSGTSPTSDDDDGDEDGEEDGEEDGDGEETPGGKRPRGAPEEEAAAQPEGSDGAEDDKDDGAAADEEDAVRIEACLCLLDPFAGEAKPGVAWPESAGGYTVLLTADEELCTVEPRANALSVLGLPDGATSFVKYVTADAPGTRFDVVIRAKMG